jgi:hypothetical protein
MKSLEADLRILALEEATRLQSQYNFTNKCHQIGLEIERVVESGLVYEVPFAIQDPTTQNFATGDFHRNAGLPDQVHISRGWNELNPERDPGWIRETFRHELAHSIGVGHASTPLSTAQLASECGRVPEPGGSNPGEENPYSVSVHPVIF